MYFLAKYHWTFYRENLELDVSNAQLYEFFSEPSAVIEQQKQSFFPQKLNALCYSISYAILFYFDNI